MRSMDTMSDTDPEGSPSSHVTLPGALTDGATILVVGAVDPSTRAIGLRLLSRYGEPGDSAPIVTTRVSADDTTQTWDEVSVEGDRPSIGIVDTTSAEQSIEATFNGVPTFFTPSSGDLERIVMALSELSGPTRPPNGSRHLVIRSLTPVLEESSPERVLRVLERISGLRTGAGLGLFGVDVSAHDQRTLTELADAVDGVVWIDRTKEGRFTSEFHPKRRHVPF